MSTRHIALVPEMGVNTSELARVSAALQKQVTRDLNPIWGISATVDAFPQIEDVPAGYWPLVLTYRDLGNDAGIHIDASGQPYAVVEMSPSWSLTASHVCLELLCDPFGNRMFAGASPRPDQGQVEYLAGICDPCEDAAYAYIVNDVLVSDFCTPSFWEPASSRERYSFTGAIQAPLEVLPGGHLRWYDPATLNWWTRRIADNGPSDLNLGRADPTKSTVREFLDARAPHHLLSTKMTVDAFEARMGARRRQALQASQSRAFSLRASFGHTRSNEEDAVHVVRSSGRQQVFGALRRASLGGSVARDVAQVHDHEIEEVAARRDDRVETRPGLGPQVTVTEPQQRSAGHRTVPPPLPQTSPPPERPPTIAPAAVPSAASSYAPSIAPAPMAPRARAPGDAANRTVVITAVVVAAAVALGIGIHRGLMPQPSPVAGVVARSDETPAPRLESRAVGAAVENAAAAPAAPSPISVGAVVARTPVVPAPVQVRPATPTVVTVRPVAPSPPPPVAAPVAPAPQRPAKQAARTVEAKNEDDLEHLIDDRR